MRVGSLGYVVAETVDLSKWENFAMDILGLMPAPKTQDGTLAFRMDERPFRLLVREASADRLGLVGWEFYSKSDFEAVIARLCDLGRPVDRLDALGARQRQAYEVAQSSDPAGNVFEIFYGRFLDYAPFVSPAAISGFVTGAQGMGHIVLSAPNFAETHDFYRDALGFRDTDLGTFPSPVPGAGEMRIAFMHAANPRHHSLAIIELPQFESGAAHLMLQVANVDDVGRVYDKVLAGGASLSVSLGRHVNDGMLSFYLRTPSGFDIEFGCDGLEIDPDRWVPTTSLVMVEGHLDSAHVGILHDDWNLFGRQVDSSLSQFVRSSTDISTEDDAPRIEVQETAHGFYSGAIRNASFRGNDASYARIHAFMVPWLSLVPPGMYAFEVPLNDHQVSYLLVTWDPDRRIDREEYRRRRCSSGAFVEEVPDNLVMRFTGTAENGWHQDRIRMRNGESFSGMSEFVSEDFAVTTSMGPILDRSREHLVPSDAAVVSMRRQLLRAAKNLQNGIEPPMMSTEESAQIRVSDGIIEPGQRWQDLLNACQANLLQNPTNPAGA